MEQGTGPIEHEARGDGSGVFFVERGGERVAQMSYVGKGEGVASINHTHVDEAQRGQGLGAAMVEAAVGWARQAGTRLSATCSFARGYFEEHRADLGDVLA